MLEANYCCVWCFFFQPDWQPLSVQLETLRINIRQQAASCLGIVSNALMQVSGLVPRPSSGLRVGLVNCKGWSVRTCLPHPSFIPSSFILPLSSFLRTQNGLWTILYVPFYLPPSSLSPSLPYSSLIPPFTIPPSPSSSFHRLFLILPFPLSSPPPLLPSSPHPQSLIICLLVFNMVSRFLPVDHYSLYVSAIIIQVTELGMPLWFCCSLWNFKQ